MLIESDAAVELYTPFAPSPPNQMSISLSARKLRIDVFADPNPDPKKEFLDLSPDLEGPAALYSQQTPQPISSIVSSSSTTAPSTSTPPQPTPVAFFTVNRSDHVIVYFDQAYQDHMVYTYLSTLNFIHSDCYELFHIQKIQNIS